MDVSGAAGVDAVLDARTKFTSASAVAAGSPLLSFASARIRYASARRSITISCSPKLRPLFRERGFEFYWECQRRTDMIRFGKYEGTWTEKDNTDKDKRIFPIPQTAIDGASIIPGYLVQNQGY